MATATPASDTDFMQLLRGSSWAGWKPAVALPVAALAMLVIGGLALPVAALFEPQGFLAAMREYGSDTPPATVPFLVALNLSLAAGIPVAWFCVRVFHRLPIGWASSVVGRLRWGLLGRFLLVALATLLVTLAVSALLPVTGTTGSSTADSSANGAVGASVLALGIALLLTTPLQATGEEYIFRGYLMQALGGWARNPALPILLSAAAFAAVHGQQNLPLLADRFAFGIVAGIAVVVTGGLEAAIAMHVLNNLFALGIALVTGTIAESLTATEASWWNLPVTLVQSAVFLALVMWVARRYEPQTRTPALASQPVAV